MKEQLESRLKVLRVEYDTGEKMIAEAEAKVVNLRTALLRISGAIQVLEEELAKANGDGRETRVEQQSQVEATAADRVVHSGTS